MWDQLKKIIKTSNDKAVIVEDGEPCFVVLTIQEYERLSSLEDGINSDRSVLKKEDNLEKANEELSSIEIDEGAKDDAERMIG